MADFVDFEHKNETIRIFNPPELFQNIKFYNKNKNIYKSILNKKVPDVIRYIFKYYYSPKKSCSLILNSINKTKGLIKNQKYYDIDCSKQEKDYFKNNKNIVLLLESPHNKEYNYYDKNNQAVNLPSQSKVADAKKVRNIKGVAPAQGRTGEKIHRWLSTILSETNEFENEENYKIIIANPVQYQASVHCLHGQSTRKKKYKELRNDLWVKLWLHNKKDFINRINNYSPYLVINSCTKNLRKIVTSQLLQINKVNKIYETNHPSSWFTHKNRAFKKIKSCLGG